MSNSISHAEDGAHSGPIKNPRQFMTMVLAAFVLPIFIIIGLVLYVTNGPKPAGTNSVEAMNMGGVTEMSRDRALAQRIQKVGTVEIRDANRPLKSGEEVFKAQCSACHTSGVAGAPKFGDKGAWAPRIAHGYEALLTSALKGKGAMSPQGGGDFNDTEIGRAVVYMANAGGANFPEPKGPAPAGAEPAAAAPMAQAATPATPASAVLSAETPAAQASAAAAVGAEAKASAASAATASTTTAPAAAAPASPAAPAVDLAAGEALYKSACFACHASGVAGAPKFGNKADWAPRIATGMDTLVNAVKHGLGAMPPRGGTSASDEQIASAVAYMVNAAK